MAVFGECELRQIIAIAQFSTGNDDLFSLSRVATSRCGDIRLRVRFFSQIFRASHNIGAMMLSRLVSSIFIFLINVIQTSWDKSLKENSNLAHMAVKEN